MSHPQRSPSQYHLGAPAMSGAPGHSLSKGLNATAGVFNPGGMTHRNSYEAPPALKPDAAPFQPGGGSQPRLSLGGYTPVPAHQYMPPRLAPSYGQQLSQLHIPSPGGVQGQHSPQHAPYNSPFSAGPAGLGAMPSPGLRPPMPVSPGGMLPTSPLSSSAGGGGGLSPNFSSQQVTPSGMPLHHPFSDQQSQQQQQQNPGFGRGGFMAGRGARRNRGPPPVNQPFKTTGHNSKPSVSLNPAVFAAALASQGGVKPKRKVVVAMPKEAGMQTDVEEASEAARVQGKTIGLDQEAIDKKVMQASQAALIRSRWSKRLPEAHLALLDDHFGLEWALSDEDLHSTEMFPEDQGSTSQSLPDFIEIYLPGQGAWEEFRELLATEAEEKRQQEAEEKQKLDKLKGGDEKEGEAKGEDDEETEAIRRELPVTSISSPADAEEVSTRLQDYLHNQRISPSRGSSEHDGDLILPVPVQALPSDVGVEATARSLSRFGSDLRLSRPRSKEGSGSESSKNASSLQHNQTMSLSMPSSGGPFGPGALSALGLPSPSRGEEMERSYSDSEENPKPALGQRPLFERNSSTTSLEATRKSMTGSPLRLLPLRTVSPSLSSPLKKERPSWKDLGRGFGYDIEEEPNREEVDNEGVSKSANDLAQRVGHEDNSSEDADESDNDDRGSDIEEGETMRQQQQHQRTKGLSTLSEEDDGDGEDDASLLSESDSDLIDSVSASEEYSNPSDEEAARHARSERNALRAERRAAKAIARSRQQERERRQRHGLAPLSGQSSNVGAAQLGLVPPPFKGNRNRAYTGDTLPSSSIGGQRDYDDNESDIISNPSDEIDDDDDEDVEEDSRGLDFAAAASNGPLDVRQHPSLLQQRMGRNFSPSTRTVAEATGGFYGYRDAGGVSSVEMQATSSRASSKTFGGGGLNPTAPEFSLGGRGGRGAQGRDGEAETGESAHFRLPSINNSSFGGSLDLREATHSATRSLNAAAPSFTPGAFTFQAPGGAPKLPQLALRPSEREGSPGFGFGFDFDPADMEDSRRVSQGREKRQRFRGSDGLSTAAAGFDDEVADGGSSFLHASSPPRPRPSAASIEGPLRHGFDGYDSQRHPPPFHGNPRGPLDVGAEQEKNDHHATDEVAGKPQGTTGTFAFKATAPSFTPTWGRASTSASAYNRPGIPSFGDTEGATEGAVSSRTSVSHSGVEMPSADFTFSIPSENKAIPIRRPDERSARQTPLRTQGYAHGHDQHREQDGETEDQENRSMAGPTKSSPQQMARHGRGDHAAAERRRPLGSLWQTGGSRSEAIDIPRSQPQHAAHASLSSSLDMSLDDDGEDHDGGVMTSRRSQTQPRSRRSHAQTEERVHRANDDNDDNDEDGEDSDSDTVSDIIEELGQRMDKSLEGWAGKILDEVTIMGQVRPANMVSLDSYERETLIGAIIEHVERIVMDNCQTLSQTLTEIATRQLRAHSDNGTDVGNDSGITIKARHQISQGSLASSILESDERAILPAAAIAPLARGHAPLDAQGELDFDFVQEILDQKISNLLRDVSARFDTALPAAMGDVTKKLDEAVEKTTRTIGQLSITKAEVDDRHKAKQSPSVVIEGPPKPVELSTEASETLAALLIGRLQPVLEEAEQNGVKIRRAELVDVMEPLLEEHMARTRAKAEAERQAVTHALQEALNGKLAGWERSLADIKEATGDQMQTLLVKTLLPHLETLRTDAVDSDLVAARVTEMLAPILEEVRQQQQQQQRERLAVDSPTTPIMRGLEEARNVSEDGRSTTMTSLSSSAGGTLVGASPYFGPETIAEATLEKLRPFLSASGRGVAKGATSPWNVEELAEHLSVAMAAKQRPDEDRGLDLEPVLALLEPLVAKQEEARSLARKIVDQQREVESTLESSLGAFPKAVNAKMEVFLSTAQQTHDAHRDILSRLDALSANLDGSTTNRATELEERREELLLSLDEARREASEAKVEVEATRAELSVSSSYNAQLKEELSRLASRLDLAEKGADEVSESTAQLRKREAELQEQVRASQKEAHEAESKRREAEAQTEALKVQDRLMKAHIDELAAEMHASREDRTRERDSAAQATAEALARCARAEERLLEVQKRADERVDEAARVERHARDEVQRAAEDAARSAGEIAALQKRVGEQDNKISNLQQLTATQKQKAAQSQQKLSEAEKRTMNHERQTQELAVANARLAEMEARVQDREDLEVRLRQSQNSGMDLRQDLTTHHARFLDLERDLITMKETLVGKEELEASQAEVVALREEAANLRGQLAAAERQIEQQHQQQQQHRDATVAMPPTFQTGGAPIKTFTTWHSDDSPSNHGSSTWASIHAPSGGDQTNNDVTQLDNHHLRSDANNEASFFSGMSDYSVLSHGRAVARGDDGWWS